MNETAAKLDDAGIDADRQCLARVLAGELDAYADIMRRHNQRLFRLARSIVTVDAEAAQLKGRSASAAPPADRVTWCAQLNTGSK